MYQVKKVSIAQLKDPLVVRWLYSLSVWPVSPARLASYLTNPNADPGDDVIYVVTQMDECVAFRTILPDLIRGRNGQIKVAWLSGTWVKPSCRGKKLSLLTLHEVMKDWSGRLMFTNYSPVSENVNLQSHEFDLFLRREGMRFYLRSPLSVKFQCSFYGSKFLLKFADSLVNMLFSIHRTLKSRCNVNHNEMISPMDMGVFVDAASTKFSHAISKRESPHFSWILQHPWIGEGEPELRYPFTWLNMGNCVLMRSVVNSSGIIIAFALVNVKQMMATIPYFWCSIDEAGHQLTQGLVDELTNRKVLWLTIFDPSVTRFFIKHRLLKKSVKQNYYISHLMKGLMHDPHWYHPVDGDGDVVFV